MLNLKSSLAVGALCLVMMVMPAGAIESDTRTRILLSDPDTRATHEVSDKRTFFDGERFRLAVNPNQPGYLYVLCRTSQGEARLLFPNTASGNNRVDAGTKRTLPERGWFRFDEEPGTEHVFVMVSPRPISELDAAADDGGELDGALLDRYTHPAPHAWRNAGGYEDRGIDIEREAFYSMKVLHLRHESR
jgi:hypothetical protein